MKTNMGVVDRTARIIVAVLIGVFYFTGIINGTVAIVLLVFGIILTITSLIGTCPAYLPFGFSTLRRKVPNENPDSAT